MSGNNNNSFREDGGVTSIEYALIASLISVVIIIAVGSVGQALIPLFTDVAAGFPG